ncbi:sensitivity to high expression protein she9 [Cadophora gregata]|uniref:sensitivity to high expression protein she9 n=1 Tax=Cadophora gregata TaxID=51156 RepID=UPI0026DCE445|nr:sensitivity to high expression protein she9 [Cadophora gregata]KAK0119757.1 sensitivity to high expression protein she9 [Cadophora gregata]KAK0120790.1 sensitivity to high expression protein she9 [Cadophora gregata f. sp. sojae]
MQPLARFVPRLFFDSIASSTTRQSLRIPSRSSLRPTTCLQCRIRTHVRHFADSPKPPPNSSQSNPISNTPSASSLDTADTASAPENASKSPIPEDEPTDLPSAEESRRLAVTKRFSHLMDHLQGNIFIASQRINDLTGYSGIEALKSRITLLEKRVSDAQEAVRSSRLTYKTTVADRAATQREVTGLLARKDSWTPTDLERFTALYRMDHTNEQAVQESATKLADSEREAEHAASKLSSSILSRYHEEQIWSDKIRRMSTWGTWGLMGVNVLLFLVFQFGFEPWRRRRLVHGFEEKVREALEKEKFAAQARSHDSANVADVPLDSVVAAGIQELEEEAESGTESSEPAVNAVVACIEGEQEPEAKAAVDPEDIHVPTELMKLRARSSSWAYQAQATFQDLFSNRLVEMRKQDITLIALEGAATGAAIVTIIATLLIRPS